MKLNLPSLANWLLALCGVVILFMGTYRFCIGETGDGSAAAGAGLVLLLAATIDRFKFFKGWGLELQTRELERTIESAESTLARLRTLTDVSAKALMRLCLSVPGYTPEQLHELSRSVKALLEQNGEGPAGVHEALDPWVYRCINTIRVQILSRAHHTVNSIREVTVLERAAALQLLGRTVQSDPAFMQIQQLHRIIYDHVSVALPLPELLQELRELALASPHKDISLEQKARLSEVLDDLRRVIGVWMPQFEHLQNRLEWEDKELWLKALSYGGLER